MRALKEMGIKENDKLTIDNDKVELLKDSHNNWFVGNKKANILDAKNCEENDENNVNFLKLKVLRLSITPCRIWM